MCYFNLQFNMTRICRSIRLQRSETDNALTWDVIDEAKAHFKSASYRMKADDELYISRKCDGCDHLLSGHRKWNKNVKDRSEKSCTECDCQCVDSRP